MPRKEIYSKDIYRNVRLHIDKNLMDGLLKHAEKNGTTAKELLQDNAVKYIKRTVKQTKGAK